MGRQLDKAMGKVTDHKQWQFCGLLERVWMSDTPSRGQGAEQVVAVTLSSLF